MAGPLTRRGALGGGMAATLGLIVAPALAGEAAADPVAVPEGPMRLQRQLIRPLKDGKQVVATREWRMRFEPLDTGWAVTGAQTSYHVDAPARLAKLVAVEERRGQPPMLPLELSRAGRIVAAAPAQLAPMDEMLAAARDYLRDHGGPGEPSPTTIQMLALLTGRGDQMLARPPLDLFFPVAPQAATSRDMAAPGGISGRVTIAIAYETEPATGLMRSYRREITTRVDTTTSRAIELWSLGAEKP